MADFEILGSPSDIRTRVAMMRSQATVYESVATNLSRVAAEGWKGRAADRFRERFSFEPRKWLDAAAGFRVAADALEVFAGALESAQSSAAACAREYARGEEVTRSARAGYEAEVKAGQRKKASWEAAHGPGTFTLTVEPFVDPGEAVRAGAKSVFASVCAQLNAAAETAAAGVRAGCAAAPRERNWLEKAGAFAGSVVSGAGEAVMELAAMADQANPLSWVRDDLMSLASGRFTAEELLASKRMQAEDMMALAKAVRDNPGEFVKQAGAAMIDLDTWRHDPGRALGRLLPDAALTLATAGGGAAARGTRGASRAAKGVEAAGAAVERSSVLSRLSRRVTDVSSCADPIDVATGEVFVSMVDVELPGVLPVVIGRTYSSAYGRGRFFGTTWASSLDEHVEVDAACGAAVFYRADKASLVYQMGGLGEAVSPLVGDAWPLTWLTPQQAEGFGVAGAVCAVFDPGAGVYRVFEADPDAPLVLGRVSGGVPAWVDVDLDAGLSSYRLAAIVDGLGNRIEVSYDEAGVPSVWRHSGGYVVEFAADPSGTRVGQIAVGRDGGRPVVVSRFTYDSAGLVASEAAGEVPADGASQAVTRCGYDAVGRMTWWVDSNGERYDYTYDEAGRCVAGVGSGGTLNSLLEYDADELVTRVQDATGAWWRHEHDGAGHVVAVTDPLGAVTRTTWDERGRRVAVVDAAGGVSSWTYDDAGNVSAVSGPGGRTVRVEYLPGRGLPTRVVGADGAVSGYEYDGRGLLASVTDAAGAVTRLGYDVRGALTSVTDAAGAVTVLECDLAGLPVSVTDGAGRVSWARRDVFGRVVAAGDAAGESAWAYDVAGRLTWRRDADGGVWRYVWDGEGNLVEEVDPVGGLTRHEYGRFDARTASTGPDGARTEFVYDGERRLTSVLDPAGGAWEFERDVAGRVMATVDVNGARTVVERDAVGRVVARVNAAGQRVRFRYDEHGDLVESVTDAPEGMDPVVRCFSYDGAGRLVAADGGGAPVGFARDVLGRVVAEGPAGQLVTSEFDVVGRLVGRVAPSGRRTGWAYDAGGVLAGLSAGVRQVRFGVDGAGREVSRVIDAGVELTSSWSPAGLLQAHGLTGGAPGSAGGFVGVGRSYRYDRAGHLTGLTDAAGGISEFELDPAGRVLAVTTDGVVSERYAYDPTGALSSTYVISDEKQGVSGGGFAKSGSLTKCAPVGWLGRVATSSRR
ncbi:hypothetical protein KEM60_01158 [Austwickia sp. TVS 96-490-7B]|uniref:putative T7SS-secreted protein n=1 Tax=Austwickia sp. TVS 96-490-7B TaxID=2830843 RepID=UPI001C589694|nr:hypothetical protein [Austwickia sp. TVS 96-490-7B]